MSGLHVFSIGDIPVRVSPWYGLLLLLWFSDGDLQRSLLWALVVTVSILVHEFGHALVARAFGLRPSILIHGLGGLCLHDHARRDRDDVLILAAGPGAGLLLGGVTWLVARLGAAALVSSDTWWVGEALRESLYINIGWSFVNLLPIWPLDGGQLFRLAMLRLARPLSAERIVHWVSLALLGVGLFFFHRSGGMLLALMVLWIAWANISGLRGEAAVRPVRRHSKHAAVLLSQAKRAYAEGDLSEAARLCHLIRREEHIADRVLRETWVILGVSAARMGDHRDALSFLKRAPTTSEVTEARIECLYALGLDDDLDLLLRSREFQRIAPERRREILDVISAEA